MRTSIFLCFVIVFVGVSAQAMAGTIKFAAPTGQVPQSLLDQFEDQTDHKVVLEEFDTEAALEEKLLSGTDVFDLVLVSSHPYAARQITADIYQKLDIEKVKGYDIPDLLSQEMMSLDAEYGAIWRWDMTGIGYAQQAIGEEDIEQLSNLAFLFKQQMSEDLNCKIAVPDSPQIILSLALQLNGISPNTQDPEELDHIKDYLSKAHKNWLIMPESDLSAALVSGDACAVLGWSSDVIKAWRGVKNKTSQQLEEMISAPPFQAEIDKIQEKSDQSKSMIDGLEKQVKEAVLPQNKAQLLARLSLAYAEMAAAGAQEAALRAKQIAKWSELLEKSEKLKDIENSPFVHVLSRDGAILKLQLLAIPKKTDKADLSYELIDFLQRGREKAGALPQVPEDANLFYMMPVSQTFERQRNRLWEEIKAPE